MKKYITPAIRITKVQTGNMIMATLPVSGTEVSGSEALGKGENVWNDGEEE